MLNYAIVEIKGKQYKALPNGVLTVDFLGEDVKDFECEKVLLLSDDDKLEVGAPYVESKLKFTVIEHKKQKKIRVATYHAKANTRRVIGSRRQVSKIKLVA